LFYIKGLASGTLACCSLFCHFGRGFQLIHCLLRELPLLTALRVSHCLFPSLVAGDRHDLLDGAVGFG
jgi:hypothetical protein